MSTLSTLPPNQALERKMNIAAWIISAAVLVLVVMMRYIKIPLPDGWDLSFLPGVHAILNGLAAVSLILALVMIKQKKVEAHQRFILAAMGFSVLFLLGYVTYHFTSEQALFGDANHNGIVEPAEQAALGWVAPVYYVLLITHIVLAGATLPFILLTFNRAYTRQFERHKKLAKRVFPFWLYVAVTGPIVYLMMAPYYG